MGQIMLDFQWNCMIEQQGWQKVALPAYDQPLWRGNGSWFEPPTIRGISSIVFEVVGTASGQKWFSYADDVIFAAIDLGGGFKSPEQVGLDLAKTAATAVISMGCSSAGSAVGKVADASLKGAGKVLAKAGISAATSYATSVGTSFVNNWNFDADGNLAFDSESFGKSTYSAQTIAGSVGAGVTAGLTTAANMKMKSMGDKGAAVNKFYGTAVNAGISAAGKLSEYAVYSAYALAEGRTLADAYDDMGGLTFNIGSLGMFADMMASGIARNNATGQAGNFGEIAQKLEGKGILEINIGSNGIKGKFGMGGFDLAGSLYTFGKRMSDKAALEAYAMQEGVSQKEAETAYWAYVYGDWTQENTMARISSGRDKLHIVEEMADGANAQTVQKADGSGRVITMKDTGDFHTNAVTLGHESYRDGIVRNQSDQQRETFNAVLGHTGMAERMTQYDNDFIFTGLLAAEIEAYKNGDMTALMMDSLYNYSSDADYWKIISKMDGTISIEAEYDKNGRLIREVSIDYQDEEGNSLLSDGPIEIEGQTFQKNLRQVASLGNAIGFDRVGQLLNVDLNNSNTYDDQTLYDIFGEEGLNTIRQTGRIPDNATQAQKAALAGEAFLKLTGNHYDGETWVTKDGEKLGQVAILTDKAKGSLVPSVNLDGTFNYKTVFEDIERHPLSYTINNGDNKLITYQTPNRFLDTRTVYQFDLDGNILTQYNSVTNKNEELKQEFKGWITVQSAVPDKKSDKTSYTKNDFIDMHISGSLIKVGPETIKEGPVAYKMLSAPKSTYFQDTLKLDIGDLYTQAVYGQILAGNKIQIDGNANFASGRHLTHPAAIGNNSGCGVTSKNNYTKYTNYLYNLGMRNNYVIFGNIKQKSLSGLSVY